MKTNDQSKEQFERQKRVWRGPANSVSKQQESATGGMIEVALRVANRAQIAANRAKYKGLRGGELRVGCRYF